MSDCPKNCNVCEIKQLCLKCASGFELTFNKSCAAIGKASELISNEGYWQLLGVIVYISIFLLFVVLILLHRWAKFKYWSRDKDAEEHEIESELRILNENLSKSVIMNKTVDLNRVTMDLSGSSRSFNPEEISESYRPDLNIEQLGGNTSFKVKHDSSNRE